VTKLTDWAKNPETLRGMDVVVVPATEGGVDVVLESEVGAVVAGALLAVIEEVGAVVSPQPASTNTGSRTRPAMANRCNSIAYSRLREAFR
jgi:hypothetical protein